MILPGLVSIAFYRRRPRPISVALGLVLTVVLSAFLGYISPPGPLTQIGSVVVAVVGGAVLYFAILAYLYTRYTPKFEKGSGEVPAARPPPM